MMNKVAWIFPGQGAQYPKMVKDFYEEHSSVRHLFEQAEDVLKRDVVNLLFDTSMESLTETKNSQVAIFLASCAILTVLRKELPSFLPHFCAGLSLGEYSALYTASILSFEQALFLVDKRASLMHEACLKQEGCMSVVIGLDQSKILSIVKEASLPKDLFAANFNCPSQSVLSGTKKGIEAGEALAKKKGALKCLRLPVAGAFHSGLMKSAEERLAPFIEQTPFSQPFANLVQNVTGKVETDLDRIKQNLIKQVTGSVFWEDSVRTMDDQGVSLYIEIGPGKTLTSFNRKIGVSGKTVNIEKTCDLESLFKEVC